MGNALIALSHHVWCHRNPLLFPSTCSNHITPITWDASSMNALRVCISSREDAIYGGEHFRGTFLELGIQMDWNIHRRGSRTETIRREQIALSRGCLKGNQKPKHIWKRKCRINQYTLTCSSRLCIQLRPIEHFKFHFFKFKEFVHLKFEENIKLYIFTEGGTSLE